MCDSTQYLHALTPLTAAATISFSPRLNSPGAIARFMARAGKKSYDELHAWSIAEPEDFWNLVWDFCEVRGRRERVLASLSPGYTR